jgi:hypothetical protein
MDKCVRCGLPRPCSCDEKRKHLLYRPFTILINQPKYRYTSVDTRVGAEMRSLNGMNEVIKTI